MRHFVAERRRIPEREIQALDSRSILLSLQGNGRSKLQQRFQVLPQYLVLLILRERLEALDPAAGSGIPWHERPVTAQQDTIDSHPIDQEAQRFLARGDGIVVQAALIDARRLRDVARFGTPVPYAIEASHCKACRTAAMGD